MYSSLLSISCVSVFFFFFGQHKQRVYIKPEIETTLVFKSNISPLHTIILDSGKSHFECTASVCMMTH